MNINYQDYQNQKENRLNNNNKSYVNFFDLKNNGDEAIVRFNYTSPSEFNLFTVHKVQINNKWKTIDCLNTPDTNDKCPLCREGKAQRKFFIKLVQYIKNENNEIEVKPKIWERSDRYIDTLTNLFTEYGNISEYIFKIRRNGDKGDVKTSYDIMYANPAIYKNEIYPKDFSAFNTFNFSDYYLLTKTAEEMEDMLNTNIEKSTPDSQPVQPQIIKQPVCQNPTTQVVTPTQTPPTGNINNFDPTKPRRTYSF